jgi:hypothetical protein
MSYLVLFWHSYSSKVISLVRIYFDNDAVWSKMEGRQSKPSENSVKFSFTAWFVVYAALAILYYL